MICEAGLKCYCLGQASERHHIKSRRRGGSDDPHNLMHVCLCCHGWIHRNPKAAHDRGWLLHSWEAETEKPIVF